MMSWHGYTSVIKSLLSLCVGNLPAIGGFPIKEQAMQSLDVFFVISIRWLLLPQVYPIPQAMKSCLPGPVCVSETSRTPQKWHHGQENDTIAGSTGLSNKLIGFPVVISLPNLIQSWFTTISNCYNMLIVRVKHEPCLTHWGLMTPFGDIDLGQHWLR